MALFVDGSDPSEIKGLFAWGAFSGVTTSPLIISRESPGADLAEAGAHVGTVPPAILHKMVWHPRTVETIAEFNEAWRKRSGPR